jgi:hypothetical protein
MKKRRSKKHRPGLKTQPTALGVKDETVSDIPQQPQRPQDADEHKKMMLEYKKMMLEYKKLYDSTASAQVTLLDKSIISIAGASFSIALAFVEKFVPLDDPSKSSMFWFSLLILAFSIILIVLSFGVGEKTARLRSRCAYLCAYGDGPTELSKLEKSARCWAGCLSWLNGLRLFFFSIGFGLLAASIFYNGITRVQSAKSSPAPTALGEKAACTNVDDKQEEFMNVTTEETF